jgi:hypothetical protein
MQTLHLKTNEHVMNRILGFLDILSKEGAEIDVLDDLSYRYEKKHIDIALDDIKNGTISSFEEVKAELLSAD